MSSSHESDRLLVQRIRSGDTAAWEELIQRFEGRLQAFVRKRLGKQDQAEDVVQETFIGFLNSLPHFDTSRPLEGYLFSIASNKLTNLLRSEGRRPTISLTTTKNEESSDWDIRGPRRAASSLFRSQEQQQGEEVALVEALSEQLSRYRERGEWEKLQCIELIMVRGWANKDVATHLEITEQQVANYKYEFVAKLRQGMKSHSITQIYGLD